ncbi:SIMPL domain-containing protein [Hydrogenophaga sp. 5NK40-0174]|uniref:SIMPL domain-containing protein n=1 Tax=Hydrogenophaga sp. 5NK40-0174 TaxID=3127649 RepID=UPI00310A269A
MYTFIARIVTAALVAAGIVIAGMAIGQGFERFRMSDRSIQVKGLAEKEVDSDFAIWAVGFRRAGKTFSEVQEALAADRQRVVAFLKSKGFADAEIEPRPLIVEDLLSRDYAQTNVPFRFNGKGKVLVKTSRVSAAEASALALDPLIQAGVELAGDNNMPLSGPTFQLRNLNAHKAALLAEATRNAREQATSFAAEAGARLGPLKRANQGVISISGDDGRGYDDGSTRMKRLRVVSSFEYELR